MQDPDVPSILPHLFTAAGVGGLARIILALHGGERKWPVLLLEGGLGALIGQIVAAGVLYIDPTLHVKGGYALFVLAGAAGFGGAMGVRLLDVVINILQKRFGG